MDLSADIAFAEAVLSGAVPPRILKAAQSIVFEFEECFPWGLFKIRHYKSSNMTCHNCGKKDVPFIIDDECEVTHC